MQNPIKITRDKAPLLDLMNDAAAVEIEELGNNNANRQPTKDGERTFYVRVSPKIKEPAKVAHQKDPKLADDRQYQLQCAELLIDSEDYLLARNIYSKLLKKDIKDPAALKGFGICQLGLRNDALALKCFTALFQMFNSDEATVWIGICYAHSNQDQKAMRLFSEIANIDELGDRDQFELAKTMGNCHTRSGKFKQAQEQYTRALRFNKQADVVHVNLGTLELQRSNFDEARSNFYKAIEIKPSNDKAHCGLAFLSITQNDIETARRALETALDLNPQNEVALGQYVNIAITIDKYIDESRERIQKFLKRDFKNADAHYWLASVYYKQTDWVSSEKEANQTLTLDPRHDKALQLKKELQQHKPTA